MNCPDQNLRQHRSNNNIMTDRLNLQVCRILNYRKSGNCHSRLFLYFVIFMVFNLPEPNVKMHFQVSNFSFFLDSNKNYMTLKISILTVY